MFEKINKERRLKNLSGAVLLTLIVLLLLLGLLYLDKGDLLRLPQTIGRIFRHLLLIVGTLFAITLVLRLTMKRFYRLFDEPEERIFYSKIYSWSLYSIGLLVILHHFGVSLGNITLFLGLIATGLAFAIREVLLSFFAWLILLRKKPFRIGDYIRIGEDEGKVLHIGTFFVLLDKTTQLPEDFTRVPNRLFLEKSIINLGKNTFHEEITFQCADFLQDKDQVLEELRAEIETLLENRENLFIYFDLRKEKLVVVVEYLTRFEERQPLRSAVIEAVYKYLGSSLFIPK
ncbi:MAG: mechanosensitive ion channel [Bacteroidales bacterium]|nr:mechanosensitive ion channel [Bacteroidales bacterium]